MIHKSEAFPGTIMRARFCQKKYLVPLDMKCSQEERTVPKFASYDEGRQAVITLLKEFIARLEG